jgi:hypothetical protein
MSPARSGFGLSAMRPMGRILQPGFQTRFCTPTPFSLPFVARNAKSHSSSARSK